MALKSLVVYSSNSDEDSDDSMQDFDTHSDQAIIQETVNCLLIEVERQFSQNPNKLHFTSNRNKLNHFDSDRDSDDLSSWSDIDSDENEEYDLDQNKPCITKGELTFDDLPKIEKLNISSPIEQLIQVGNVSSIVNQLVIIKSFTTIPVLDLESILFLKNGSELGQVFDVIGPVKQPNYVIRFNSNKEIRELKIEMNIPVYYNPNFPEPYTKYVFVNNLIKEKGCDASWKDNNEPPPEHIDYSDDETEYREKWKLNAKLRRRKN